MAAPDYTDKYNTELDADEEQAFKEWLEKNSERHGRDLSKDLTDYDLRGLFKELQGGELPEGHGPDTHKKPNHPTFSTDSKYHGTDGNDGGEWTTDENGNDVYTPSKTNLSHYTPAELRAYWKRAENDAVRLALPGAVGMYPNTKMAP